MHQPKKFNDVKDSIVAKEWLESMESAIMLFDMIDQERVKYTTYCFQVKCSNMVKPSQKDN